MSEDRFEDYFKGVAIVPDLAGSESLLTFTVADSSAALVLHYHLSDELSTEKELWFFPNTDTQFNHIDHDRSGTDMAGYPMKEWRYLRPSLVTGAYYSEAWVGIPVWNSRI